MDDPPNLVKTDFSKMDLFIKLKSDKSCDPFAGDDETADEDFPFEKHGDASRRNRGRLASYAAALAGTQFRVHTFCVIMYAGNVRFIRWDRSGAIVTERFNCAKRPYFLAQFFWRFSHLNPEHKGHDTSVSPVPKAFPPQILDTLRERISPTEPSKTSKNSSRKQTPVPPPTPPPVNPKEFRIFKVPDRKNPEEEKDFVVWLRELSDEYTARSPFGRGTRLMLAYDVEKNVIFFLKDYWRAEGVDKEGDIYELLESHRVPNIPPFGKGNDVRKHATFTDVLKAEGAEWALPSKEMTSYKHYRMTLDVVARPLTSFKSSREFVGAIADAMEDETSFGDFTLVTNSWLSQHMIVPTSMLESFIVTSA